VTARELVLAISTRPIGLGRDAAPIVERGLFDGVTARCRSFKRGSWLITAELPTETEALAALLAQCIAECEVQPHEISKYCPLFDGQSVTLFGG
jgi:hypothetical protein